MLINELILDNTFDDRRILEERLMLYELHYFEGSVIVYELKRFTFMGKKLATHFVDRIASTHMHMKESFSDFDSDLIHVLFAEEQTGGVGQWKNSWRSPKGGIYATFYFQQPPPFPYEELTVLLAKVAIEMVDGWVEAKLKYPNDILVNGEKIGGVLCHVIDDQEVILSIGLNVNTPKTLLLDVGQEATSLMEITGQTFDLRSMQLDLAGRLHARLQERFDHN
jgi:BirA family transcriptional regulator, biotin operon repressor / biotin---[acetyl-CoA-carboxylase] ligase